jgi:A/G-specific adenine glycosylase
MTEYDGKLPIEASKLRNLSGIGDYTAGAIASISFGKPEPAVDGNVLRVITRVLGCYDDIMLSSTKKTISEELRAVYPTGENAKNLTQGIMELGEALCIPNGEAKCELCPLRELCEANKKKLTDVLPVKTPKKARKIENHTVILLSCRGKYAIRKRPETGLLAKLWEYPNLSGHITENDISSWLTEQGLTPISIREIGEAVHIFTHVEWHMTGFAAECAEESPAFTWHTAEEIREGFAIPTAFRAYTKQLE